MARKKPVIPGTPAARLSELLERRYETIVEAAEAWGVKRSTLTSHANGQKPLTQAAAKIYARRLGCTWQWLLNGVQPTHIDRLADALSVLPEDQRERLVRMVEGYAFPPDVAAGS